jgi:hypothetical protein
VLRIRDPVLFWPLDPGWKQNSEPVSGMNISDLIFENLVFVFGITILKFFDADPGCPDPDLVNPGSRMKKSDQGSGINIPDPQHWFLYRNEDAAGFDTSWQYYTGYEGIGTGQSPKSYWYIKMLPSNTDEFKNNISLVS